MQNSCILPPPPFALRPHPVRRPLDYYCELLRATASGITAAAPLRSLSCILSVRISAEWVLGEHLGSCSHCLFLGHSPESDLPTGTWTASSQLAVLQQAVQRAVLAATGCAATTLVSSVVGPQVGPQRKGPQRRSMVRSEGVRSEGPWSAVKAGHGEAHPRVCKSCMRSCNPHHDALCGPSPLLRAHAPSTSSPPCHVSPR
jgi:hypothetical protein